MKSDKETMEMATKNETNNEWKKRNTLLINARLFNSTDADIIEVVRSSANKGKLIKDALRYYIANGCPEVEKPDRTEDE